jgi:hypothetical protein
MAAEFLTTQTTEATVEQFGVTKEGVIAGTLGAVTLAVWFLILDLLQGRPLLTPAILGTAFFQGTEKLANVETLPIVIDIVVLFTFAHWLVFVLVGGLAAFLLRQAERNPNLGFGILLLFVFFEIGFIAVAMLFAQPILQALTWPTILIGNLLAAGSMGCYLWRRHSHLTIHP